MKSINTVKGFWISPDNKYFKIEFDPFKTIWSDVNSFNITHEAVSEIFSKFGDEDSTINAVIDSLIDKNWILIKLKRNTWHINISHFDRLTCDKIWEWVYYMFNNFEEVNADTTIKLYEINSRKSSKLSFEKILLGDFVVHKSCLSYRIQNFIHQNLEYLTQEYIK